MDNNALFCSKCGTKNEANTRFCIGCGSELKTNVNKIHVDNKTVSNNTNTATLEAIRKADDTITNAYNTFYSGVLDDDTIKYHKTIRSLLKFLLGFFVFMLVLSIIINVFSIMEGPIFLPFFILAIIALVYGAYVEAPKKGVSVFKDNKYYADYKNEARRRYSNYISNNEDVKILPREYCFPLASNYIRRLFETNRENNLNDALTKCDEYLHRLAVEDKMGKMLQLQKDAIITTVAVGGAIVGSNNIIW